MKPDYPAWVCLDCGARYGYRGATDGHIMTMHIGTCDICGEERAVTEPRDFGHLKLNWRELHNERKINDTADV
jgi:hypothetical protein